MADVQIVLDQFPALVRLPHGGTIEPARVVVSNQGLLVLIGGTNGPSVFFTRPNVLSFSGTRLTGYEILVDDGVVTSYQAPGCGCGNDLRSYDPFPGQSKIQVPVPA